MDDLDRSPTLSSTCMERLGLTHQPFAAALGPDVMFEDLGITTQLNVALQLLQSGGPIILLCGPEGIGKSTFIQWLEYKIGTDFSVCRVNAHADMDLETLLHDARIQLKIPPGRPGSDSFARFRVQLHTLIDDGHHPTLFIDNADMLSDETLRELVNLKLELNERSSGMGLLLTAATVNHKEIPFTYEQIIPTQDYQAIHLLPLNEQQTETYVRHRLFVAGLSSELVAPHSVWKKIYKRSHGIPGLIDRHAADTFEAQFGESRFGKLSLPKHALQAVATIGGIAIVGGLIYLQQTSALKPAANATVTVALPSPSNTAPLDPITTLKHDETATNTPPPPPPVQIGAEPTITESPTPTIAPAAIEAAPPATTPPKPEQPETPRSAFAPPPEPEVAPPATITNGNNTTSHEPETKPAAEPAANSPATPLVAAAHEPTTTLTPAEPLKAITAPTSDAQVATTREPATEPTTHPKIVHGNSKKTKTKPIRKTTATQAPSGWLAEQPSGHFTIQLVGARNRAKVEGFVKSLAVTTPVSIYETNRNGEHWYFAVTGSYPSAAAAKQAVGALPDSAKKSGAWTRTFGSIKDVIAGKK